MKTRITIFQLEKSLRDNKFIKVSLDQHELITTSARNFSGFPISENDSKKIVNIFNCLYFDLMNGVFDNIDYFLEELKPIYDSYHKYGLVTTIASPDNIEMLKITYSKDKPNFDLIRGKQEIEKILDVPTSLEKTNDLIKIEEPEEKPRITMSMKLVPDIKEPEVSPSEKLKEVGCVMSDSVAKIIDEAPKFEPKVSTGSKTVTNKTIKSK